MRVQITHDHYATWNGSLTINYYLHGYNYDCITIGGVYSTDNPPSQLEAFQTMLRHLADHDTVSQFQEIGHCPACGDHIDYCQGHGRIGDPLGYHIVRDHYDFQKHDRCHPNADCEV